MKKPKIYLKGFLFSVFILLSGHYLRQLFLFLIGISCLVLFLLGVSTDLHAESLLYEHYPQKQVAPDTSYTETFTISGLPSNAVLTNVEVQFDYIAYGVYQDYVSARINKDSDPGTTGGAPIVSQGMLPTGNPGTYGYVSSSNWNNQNLINNTVFYICFAVASGCPGSPTISKVRLRITYSVSVATPAVSVTPVSGPQGTTFQQRGTGFTPNSTATLHFKRPDGSETDPVVKDTEPDGSFSHSWTCAACPVGTYQYWAIDNATNQSSNTVSFIVSSADSSQGLVAYYPFNGNAQDESGNANHGTVYGSTLTTDRFDFTERAYSFDGIDDYLSIPELFGSDVSSFTFSVWESTDITQQQGHIIYKGSGNGEASIALDMGRYVFSVKLANGQWFNTSADSIATGDYHHIVGVYYRGDKIEIWVDGQLRNQMPIPGYDLFVEHYHWSSIGSYNRQEGRHFSGKIDDIRIYNRALSQSEIQGIYAAEKPPPPSPDPNWVKTYRLVRAGNGHQDHLYTTSLNEKESAEASGYIYDGEDFMVSSTPFTGGVEVVRLRKDGPNYKIRLYATGATEIQSAKNQGYVQEDSLGYVYAAAHTGTAEIKRCYHAGITDRFYTAYQAEFTAALAQGYREENPLGYAPPGAGHAPEQPHATAPDSTPCVAIPPMLKASAFSHQDSGARHAASSWEVTKVQGDYSPGNLVLSRVDDTRNLTTITPDANVLTLQTRYWWRLRYKDANGRYSSWSPEASFITRCYLNTPKTLTVDGASILQHNCRGHYQKFVFNAIAGERYMATLTPISGDADLYRSVNMSDFDHLPDFPGNVLQSRKPAGNVELFSITDTQSGPFYLAGYGVNESDYRIAVSTTAVAKITANRKAVASGGTVHFDASGSAPSGHAASIASYSWEFSGGATATGVSVSHVFDFANGAVQYATLTITDDKGNIGQSVISVNVTGTTQGTTANQSAHSSDPVNMATGNLTYSHTDLVVPGRGIPFVFSRAYNSIDTYFTSGLPLGHGWTHSFNVRITGDPGGQLTVLFPDGHGEMYVFDGQSGYTAQAGVKNTLTTSAESGSRYILTLKNQLSYHFDADMRLTSIRDLNGNAIICSYDDQEKLIRITDTVGRIYAIDYDPAGHLTQITDPIGRALKYAYNGNGDLASFTDPTGAAIGYGYDDRHQMTTVTGPNGVISVNMVYDLSNRVVRSQSDVYGNAFTFSYDFETGITIQKDPLGHETIYAHDDKMRLISIKYPNGFADYFAYDDQDNRISVTNRRGFKTYYTYDNGEMSSQRPIPWARLRRLPTMQRTIPSRVRMPWAARRPTLTTLRETL